MPRKTRLEYPGAIYHVINRGNYKSWIFKQEGAKQSFEECVFDACEKNAWFLHAFVIMGNHYHLAVETPQGNLVTGMQALLVEPGGAPEEVCHYIHLNPVRAGVVLVEKLATYRFGSYWYLPHVKERPARLKLAAALDGAGDLPDSSAGWRSYAKYLDWQVKEGPLAKEKAYEIMSRGWAIGSDAFKEKLLDDHKVANLSRAWATSETTELRQRQWSRARMLLLREVTAEEKRDRRKSAPWRVKIAAHVKATTSASNAWLAEQLNMGSPFYVSKHVGLL